MWKVVPVVVKDVMLAYACDAVAEYLQFAASFVVKFIAVCVVPIGNCPVGCELDIIGGVVSGGMLLTVTDITVDVARLFEVSLAVAVKLWIPFEAVVVSQLIEYGDVVSSEPRFALSSLNWTPATSTLSVAVAVIAVMALTVAPFDGAVMVDVGFVVSDAAATLKLMV